MSATFWHALGTVSSGLLSPACAFYLVLASRTWLPLPELQAWQPDLQVCADAISSLSQAVQSVKLH